MHRDSSVIFGGVMVVLGYDLVASLASRASDTNYGLFSIGSFFIYTLFGFLLGRTGKWWFGGLCGLLLGFADSTLGWLISWYIGPGKPPVEMNVVLIGITIVLVTLTAGIFGLVGGAVSLVRKSNA